MKLKLSNSKAKTAALGALLALIAVPFSAGAQESLEEQYGQLANFARLLMSIGRIVDLLIPTVVAFALLGFFWGLTRFIANAGDESAQAAGKRLMVGGIIAFTVMLSIWGIVGFIQESFGIGGGTQIEIPAAPTGSFLP